MRWPATTADCANKTARERLCTELDTEVWAWFADRLEHNKTRVFKHEIAGIAEQYVQALRQEWVLQCDDGRADPTRPPKLPKINGGWVDRFRKRHNITWRTVNLRYRAVLVGPDDNEAINYWLAARWVN